MVRDVSERNMKYQRMLLRRFQLEKTKNSRDDEPSSYDMGDARMERLMEICQIFTTAKKPDGSAMIPSIQQSEFMHLFFNSAVGLIYGDSFKSEKKKRILTKYGYEEPKKILLMQTARQMGKSEILKRVVAILGMTMPLSFLITAQNQSTGGKIVEEAYEVVKIIDRYLPHMDFPKLITNKALKKVFRWKSGATTNFEQVCAKTSKYVHVCSPRARV